MSRNIPETLPSNVVPLATKLRPHQCVPRVPARRKRGTVGWHEPRGSSISIPYRYFKGEWKIDRDLMLHPGGVSKNGGSRNGKCEPPQPCECSGDHFAHASD